MFLPLFTCMGALEDGVWLIAAIPLLPMLAHGLWLDFRTDSRRRGAASFTRLATPEGTRITVTVGDFGVRVARGPDVRYDVPPRALKGLTRIDDTCAIWFRGGFSHFVDGRDQPGALDQVDAEIRARIGSRTGLPDLPGGVRIRSTDLRHLLFVRLRWAWAILMLGLLLSIWIPWLGVAAALVAGIGGGADAWVLARRITLGRVDDWIVGRSRGRQLGFRASALSIHPPSHGRIAVRLGELTVLTVPERTWPRVAALFDGAERVTP